MTPDLRGYDHIIVALSGGKDSVASLLAALELGVRPESIELWHHDVDGGGEGFMDWPSTPGYVRQIARAFDLPCYMSWRDGGIQREMLRNGTPTAPVSFETPDGTMHRGGEGRPGRRLRFPQISGNLAVRWCSSVAKIDVAAMALRGQDRFLGRRTLFITGERAEESPGRARYAVFEPHRTDTRASLRRPRLVDHWRPVHGWSEAMVWDSLRRHRIVPALPYRIGFGRLSCLGCIFMSADQAATFRLIAPDRFARFAAYEHAFGCTIRRDIDLNTLADRGRPFPAALQQPDLVRQALSPDWAGPVLTDHWRLPAGAFGESAGPG